MPEPDAKTNTEPSLPRILKHNEMDFRLSSNSARGITRDKNLSSDISEMNSGMIM